MGFQFIRSEGKAIVDVRWKDFHCVGDVCVPTEIRVEVPVKERTLLLRMDEVEVNPTISDEQFNIRVPSGTEPWPLEPIPAPLAPFMSKSGESGGV